MTENKPYAIKVFSRKEKYKELYALRSLDFHNMEDLVLRLVSIKNIHTLNTFFKAHKEQTGFSMINNLKTKSFMKDIFAIPVIFFIFLLLLTFEGDLASHAAVKILVLSITFISWIIYETFSTYYKKGRSTLIARLKIDDENRLSTVELLKKIVFNGEKEEITGKLKTVKNTSAIKKRRL